MTKNTNTTNTNTTLVTCDACMGWGVVDTGCDVEGTVMCHHCGGSGTVKAETEDRDWSVIRHTPVNGNAGAWARVSHGFTHEEAKAEVEAEIDLCDVIFEIPTDEVDAWFEDNTDSVDKADWSVIRQHVDGCAETHAGVAHGFTQAEALAEVEAEADIVKTILAMPTDEVDAWFAENSGAVRTEV